MNRYQNQQLIETMTAVMMMAMGFGMVRPIMLQALSSNEQLKITSEYLTKIKTFLSSDQVLIEDLSRVVDKLSKGKNISNLEWRNLISETEKLAPHMYSKVNGHDFVQRVWAIIKEEKVDSSKSPTSKEIGVKVGFTGTQIGMTEAQKKVLEELLQSLKPISEFHHGDCIGSDEQAHKMVKSLTRAVIYIHPPIDSKKRAFCTTVDIVYKPKGYLDRNRDIVDSANFLIATPKTKQEQLRSGTWATVRYAKKKGVKIFIIYPDGEISTRGK